LRFEGEGELRRQIHATLIENLDLAALEGGQLDDPSMRPRVLAALRRIVKQVDERIPASVDRDRLIGDLADEALGLGPLERFLADPTISEIMVVDPENPTTPVSLPLAASGHPVLADGQLFMASVSAVRSFQAWEAVEPKLTAAIAANPKETAPGLAYVRIALRAGKAAGVPEAADRLLIIGSNPRLEAPVINARIRKATLAGLKVAYIGPATDLTYAATQVGLDTDFLAGAERPLRRAGAGQKRVRRRLRPRGVQPGGAGRRHQRAERGAEGRRHLGRRRAARRAARRACGRACVDGRG
jgi:hypothetical protein